MSPVMRSSCQYAEHCMLHPNEHYAARLRRLITPYLEHKYAKFPWRRLEAVQLQE